LPPPWFHKERFHKERFHKERVSQGDVSQGDVSQGEVSQGDVSQEMFHKKMMFSIYGDNTGLTVLDKATEEFGIVAAPLGGLASGRPPRCHRSTNDQGAA
jgi:hypothetical protein